LQALVSFRRETGDNDRALVHARRLAELFPDDPSMRELIRTLDTAPR
jgi:hypothetical protein